MHGIVAPRKEEKNGSERGSSLRLEKENKDFHRCFLFFSEMIGFSHR